MTDEELRKAAENRQRQQVTNRAGEQRRKTKRERRKNARLARKADNTLPPDGTGRLYTHNSRKPKACFHVATALGTACKLQNSKFMKYQDSVTEAPPWGKRLCSMCADVLAGKQADAAAWERLAGF